MNDFSLMSASRVDKGIGYLDKRLYISDILLSDTRVRE